MYPYCSYVLSKILLYIYIYILNFSKEDLRVLIEEKRYWNRRWEEIHHYLSTIKNKSDFTVQKTFKRSFSY